MKTAWYACLVARTLGQKCSQPVDLITSERDQFQIPRFSLTRNIHHIKNDYTTHSYYLTYTVLLRLGECTFWTWEWTGKKVTKLSVVEQTLTSDWLTRCGRRYRGWRHGPHLLSPFIRTSPSPPISWQSSIMVSDTACDQKAASSSRPQTECVLNSAFPQFPTTKDLDWWRLNTWQLLWVPQDGNKKSFSAHLGICHPPPPPSRLPPVLFILSETGNRRVIAISPYQCCALTRHISSLCR